jgi:hypothetical protein
VVRGVSSAAVVAAGVEDVELLLAEGARALEVAGDLVASRDWFDRAYRVAERLGDGRALAVAGLGLCGLWVHEHRTTAAAVLLRTRLRRALSLVGRRSLLGLRLRVRLAGERDYRAGEHRAVLAVLGAARASGDPVAQVEALSLAHHCLLGPEHGELRQALAAELIGQSFRTARRSDLLLGLLWQTVNLFLAAEPHAARRLGELRDQLAAGEHLAVGFVVRAIEVMLAIRAGRFEEAETRAQTCAQAGARAGDIDATGWYGGQLVAIRWYQGRLVELLPMLEELVGSPTLSAVDNSYFAALAVAAATAGDRRTAAGTIATLCGRDLADLPRSSSWLVTMHGVVEAAYLLDDTDTAARAYQLLEPFAELPMMVSLGVACFGSVQHALGTAALTTGALDDAVEHLRAAVRHNLALGHWPAVMTARHRYAQALTRRARLHDAIAARREVATAAREAAALGIPVPDQRRPGAPPTRASCTRQGRRWLVEWGHRSALIEHSVGMLYLTVLLANPGAEVPAVDLVTGVGRLTEAVGKAGLSTQPLLDPAAIRDYRQRLHELDDQQPGNELVGAEHDWLVAELSGATALSGRTRRFADNTERARIAVGKAIRRAITRITQADTAIGQHLRDSVHTGIRCAYRRAL